MEARQMTGIRSSATLQEAICPECGADENARCAPLLPAKNCPYYRSLAPSADERIQSLDLGNRQLVAQVERLERENAALRLAQSTEAVVSDDDIVAAMREAGAAEKEWKALTHDHGPYDITRPNVFTTEFARRLIARVAPSSTEGIAMNRDLIRAHILNCEHHGHRIWCKAIKGPEGENWYEDDECDCSRGKAIAELNIAPSATAIPSRNEIIAECISAMAEVDDAGGGYRERVCALRALQDAVPVSTPSSTGNAVK